LRDIRIDYRSAPGGDALRPALGALGRLLGPAIAFVALSLRALRRG
jgi:hypothetical protein